MLVFAILALTVMRMIPVSLALMGLNLNLATHSFMGWFGPRGIASIIYGLLIIEAGVPYAEKMFHTMVVTVFLSLILHGVTASPLANAYARYMTRNQAKQDEPTDFPELRLRHECK